MNVFTLKKSNSERKKTVPSTENEVILEEEKSEKFGGDQPAGYMHKMGRYHVT